MGKNRVRESLAAVIANVIVHKIIARHTNKSESSHFLEAEIIEYAAQAENLSEEFNWNNEDRDYIESESAKKAIEKLSNKYPDVKYDKKEISEIFEEIRDDSPIFSRTSENKN